MIRIRKLEDKKNTGIKDNIDEDKEYVKVNLNNYLEDSQISTVYIHNECTLSIMAWVMKSKRLFPVPEVGGFLLGSFSENTGNGHNITLDKFIPSKDVAYNSPTLLEFGTKALMELDGEMDRYPEMSLIGWFHTHPGHTPFLSSIDMQLHDGFFKKTHQIAIVLDSLTPDFDTGFFSRRSDGIPNNKPEFKNWVKWNDLLEGK